MIPWVVKIFGRRPRTNDCSSSSCPKEAVVRINEIDSARNMNELKSSIYSLRLIIPDFEILDSQIANALKKGLTADFKRRSLHRRNQDTTGHSIPERQTNRLHDL